MNIDRITRRQRLAKGSRQPGSGKGTATTAISEVNGHRGARRMGIVGMAVLAGMALGVDPVANANSTGFFAAVQAAGITAAGPAMLEDGRNVCWQIWNGGYTGQAAAAALQKTNPTLTTDQAGKFVLAAYQNLCPVPGSYDWWSYGNGSPG